MWRNDKHPTKNDIDEDGYFFYWDSKKSEPSGCILGSLRSGEPGLIWSKTKIEDVPPKHMIDAYTEVNYSNRFDELMKGKHKE